MPDVFAGARVNPPSISPGTAFSEGNRLRGCVNLCSPAVGPKAEGPPSPSFGRKFFRGPRGTGFLYVRRALLGLLEPAMIDHFAAPWVAPDRYELRGDARRFETWENAYALRAGLRAAVQYALDLGLDAIQDRAWSLAERLRTSLQEVPGATIRDIGDTRCAIVSFTVDGLDPRPTVALLRERSICIGASDPSSTLLDARKRHLPTVLRASPHYYNTTSDIDALIDALQSLTNQTD